jgi:hypothetical protein
MIVRLGGVGRSPFRFAAGQYASITFGVRDDRDLYLDGHLRRFAREYSNFRHKLVLREPRPAIGHGVTDADLRSRAGAELRERTPARLGRQSRAGRRFLGLERNIRPAGNVSV